MNYLSEVCLISALWLLHASFSIYFYITLYARVVVRIIRNIIVGRRLDELLELRESLTKLPNHIAFIVLENYIDYNALASLVVWCVVVGVENISLYDIDGRIKGNQDKLLLSIHKTIKEFGQKYPCLLVWRPHTPAMYQEQSVIVYNNGAMYPDENGNGRIKINCGTESGDEGMKERRINISLLSREDGKQDISRCAVRLSRKDLKDIGEEDVAAELQTNHHLPDPGLLIRLGILQSNLDFLPWQTRLSEIHSIESTLALSLHQFTDVIRSFSKCEQRLGK
jgi:dehydrodolichyl diphosphate syntase complex subunit NUS1